MNFLKILTLLLHCSAIVTLAADTQEACNNKYKNLVKLAQILAGDPYAKVPPFLSISSERIEQALISENIHFLQSYYKSLDMICDELHIKNLKPIWFRIKRNFNALTSFLHLGERLNTSPTDVDYNFLYYKEFLFTPEELSLFNDAQQKNIFLMVRSSGLEDSKTTANAGLYTSIAYVKPDTNTIQTAISKVVKSYFNAQAIKNNLMAGLNLYLMPLCVPVLIQQLIGEPLGGTTDNTQIPVSGVAFTTNSSLGTDTFKITEINCSYGHGEGIVANKVPVDRYYVTPSGNTNNLSIYPMINYKRHRLVPSQTGLAFKKNPDAIAWHPSLNQQQVTQLYTVLQKIERAYGQPMDVEFVIQNNIAYIVQARPAMRSEQKPSYIPDTALTDAQKQTRVSCNTLVSGSSQVQIITNPDNLIIANTLDDADANERRNSAQAVIVEAWASSLSHAAVNFIGFGTPCLYVQDLNSIKNLASQISAITPLIIDVQRQQIYLWHDAQTLSNAVIQGWYEHPIQRTLSIVEDIVTYRMVRDIAIVPQDATLITKMLTLKNILGSGEQKKLFIEITERIFNRLALTEKRIKKSGQLCNDSCQNSFSAFKKKLTQVIDNFNAALDQNADRFELLFYHKMLEALLYQEHDNLVRVNQYTYKWFLDDLFIKQATIGSATGQEDIVTLLTYAEDCPNKEVAKSWRTFIQAISTSIIQNKLSPKDTLPLINVLTRLEKINGISLWFATEAYQKLKNYTGGIDPLNSFLNTDDISAMQEFQTFIENIQNNIATVTTLLNQNLNSSIQVEEFWKEINKLLIEPLTTELFIGQFEQASFLNKLLMCTEMNKTIDLIDHAIKTVKSNQVLNFAEKKSLFPMMLNNFLQVCKTWLTKIMPENALKYHSSWPLQSYLNQMDTLFTHIFNQSTPSDESWYFKKSAAFSVQAAILGSETAFQRHCPSTPEDMFMLIHQNSLIAVSAIYISLFTNDPLYTKIYMPETFRTIIGYLNSQNVVKISAIGLAYTHEKITLLYNMPLNNHSATFQITYIVNTEEISVHVQYLGEARSRWEETAILAAASPELSRLTLDDTIFFDHTGGIVSWGWKIKDQNSLPIILEYLKVMNDISMQWTHPYSVSYASLNKTTERLQEAFIKALPFIEGRIRGTLQQSWRNNIQIIR